MARSQQSFAKRQKELKRLKRREDKAQRKSQRASTGGDGTLDNMMAYVDENGQLTSVPPDQRVAVAKPAAEEKAPDPAQPEEKK